MLTAAIADVCLGRNLDRARIEGVFEAIFDGTATAAQVGGLLIALRMKGETVDEVTGAALALRARGRQVGTPPGRVVMDTCGTGGDGAGTFNLSTATAFVLAAAGVVVAKHGNARVSSRCGSADVLEAAGVATEVPVACVEACLAEIGVAFLLAPAFHPVMRTVAAARRELGVRSIFNVLGPLANPARASRQVVGVYDAALVPIVAGALAALGTERSLVVHGDGGLDELSPSGPTEALLVGDGGSRRLTINPEDAGVLRLPLASIAGGGPEANARVLREVLEGAHGPVREAVVLNAAAALWVAGVEADLARAAGLARSLLDAGEPARKLEALAARTSNAAAQATRAAQAVAS
jgi:anthranilate phosphoribosyltransferase